MHFLLVLYSYYEEVENHLEIISIADHLETRNLVWQLIKI